MILLLFVSLIYLLASGVELGPPENDKGYCSTDNCIYDDEEDDEPIAMDDDDESNSTQSDNDETVEGNEQESADFLSEKKKSSLGNWNPISMAWEATKQAVNGVYNMSVEALKDIEEIFRFVLNEEAYNMFSSALETFTSSLMKKDNLFGMALSKLEQTVLSVSILLLVIVLNYIFSGTFPLFALLAFDCSVLLVHKIFGPAFIAECIIDSVIHIYHYLSWMVNHPYLFSIIIIVLYLSSFCWPCIRYYCCHPWFRTTSDVIYSVEERLIGLEERTERMEIMLRSVCNSVANMTAQRLQYIDRGNQ